MHHVEWKTIRDKYSEFIGRIRDRAELSDLISDMVSELSALHTFVRGGDLRRAPDQVAVGSLGAMLTRDESAGGFRVDHIYRTDPDRPDKLSPLLQPGAGLADPGQSRCRRRRAVRCLAPYGPMRAKHAHSVTVVRNRHRW